MATELLQPGVSVIQEFRTVSPTIITPTLVPCAVAPCKQVIEALELDSTGNQALNTDAYASTPGVLTGASAGPFSGLDGLTLIVSVNGGAPHTTTFADALAAGLDADNVKAQVAASSPAPSGWGAFVHTVSASEYLQLKTTATGAGQTIEVLGGTANTILGFNDSFEAEGISLYGQDKGFIVQGDFPDPRGILPDEGDVDESTIRVFMSPGTLSLKEFERDETFLRNKKEAAYTAPAAATFVGLTTKTYAFIKTVGGTAQSYTYTASDPSDIDDLIVDLNAEVTDSDISFEKDSGGTKVVAVSATGYFEIAEPAANDCHAEIGWSTDGAKAYTLEASDDGDGDTTTPFITVDRESFQAAEGSAQLTGTVDLTSPAQVNQLTFVGQLDGEHEQDVVLEGDPVVAGTAFDASNTLQGEDLGLVVNGTLYVHTFTGGDPISLDDTITEINAAVGTNVAYKSDAAGAYQLAGTYLAFRVYTALVAASVPVQVENSDVWLDSGTTDFTALTDLGFSAAAGQVWSVTAIGAVHVDETAVFNSAADADFEPFPAAEAIGDYCAFGFANPFDKVVFDGANGTAGTVGVVVWEYMDEDGAWQSLTVVDGTTGFTAAVADGQEVTFTPPSDWGPNVINSSAALYYIRARITTVFTIDPVYDQGFISADTKQTLAIADIITAINATFGSGFASNDGSDFLQLDSSETGEESKVEIGNGTANDALGFTLAQTDTGAPFAPKAGDAVYGEGTLLGNIAVVSPGGVSYKLKLDREVSTTLGKVSYYIQALAIPSSLPSDRPLPDLVIDSAGAINIKHDLVRDTEGNPVDTQGQLMIMYEALRLDVTSRATTPGLLNFDDTDDLEDALEPLNTDNPLGLMLYFMLLNAPGITVSGLGVHETSTSFPDGTSTGYSSALTFLRSEEVYALAPGSQDEIIHQLFSLHVTDMSDPDNKGERIVFINPEMPGEGIPTIATSGTDGDSTAVTNEFDTKLSDLSADLLAAGIDPTGTIPVSDGVFLDIATDDYKYSVQSVTGTKILCRVAFSPGENDDDFYAETNLPSTLISETFSIKIRGADLVDTNGDPDYTEIAEAYQDLGGTYDNRRLIMVAPEEVGAVVDSVEQRIPGYYLCAAIAGMVGQQAPQQGFTNFPVTGFTAVYGSSNVFSGSEMNVGAAGGTYWVVQNVAGGALTCRHQLTTDLTSIETRELNITKVVDFTAKFMRAGLRNFIGKFNITQPFLDTLSTVIQGQLSFLTESGVIVGGDLNNIVQDSSNPDTVLIDVTLDVPYPCNYLRLTLVV